MKKLFFNLLFLVAIVSINTSLASEKVRTHLGIFQITVNIF